MKYINDLIGFFGQNPATDSYSFSLGLHSGLVGVLVVLLVVFLFRSIRFLIKFKSSKGLRIKSDQGEMFLTTAALKEFISIELKSISDIKLQKIKLFTKGSSFNLLIEISAPHLTNIPRLTDQIQCCVERGLKDSLGITTANKIDIRLKKFHATKGQLKDHTFTNNVSFVEEESLPDATE
ncbi:MAG: hypothetical protein KAG98_00775 [Lentisphaeria bacterium]|nr:hypothetical protein [Lentisphaeria bacterium]